MSNSILYRGAVYHEAGHKWVNPELEKAFIDLLDVFSGGDNNRFLALQILVREFDQRAGKGDDIARKALLPIIQLSKLIDIAVREVDRNRELQKKL